MTTETHTTRIQMQHHVGRPGQQTYRAHCSCGWRGQGGLTERQAARQAETHAKEDAPTTTEDCRVCGGDGWLPSLPEGASACLACHGTGKLTEAR